MHAVTFSHDFLVAAGIGLAGLFTHLLVTWADPHDDSVTGTLKTIFLKHGRTTLVAIMLYVGVCFGLESVGQLTVAAAFFAGYTIQSTSERMVSFMGKRTLNGNGGDK